VGIKLFLAFLIIIKHMWGYLVQRDPTYSLVNLTDI